MFSRRLCFMSAAVAALSTVACTPFTQGQSSSPPSPASATSGPLFGCSNFPYDASTAAAVEKTYDVARDNGQIFVVQLDNGVAWKEALNNEPLPSSLLNEWSNYKRHRPANRPMYLSIAPLDFDRKNLAGACAGSSVPSSIKGADFDASAVKTAYLNYCRAAVNFFDPDYLNIGVEAGELAHRRSSAWPAFARLIDHVRSNLKQEFPDLKIGISFGLQSLMEKSAADLARPLVESCDYLGLSFYPYMSDFHEKFGCKPLPSPPNEWITPLEWARNYTTRPIAICETGYNSAPVKFTPASVDLNGSPSDQVQYIKDLARLARRDNYLFVIWYFPIDINKLLASLPDGGGAAILWEDNGFYDDNLNPKPALQAWKDAVAGVSNDSSGSNDSSSGTASGPPAPGGKIEVVGSEPLPVASLAFDSSGDLFSAPAGASVTMSSESGPDGGTAMEWSYSYKKKNWAWASKSIGEGKLARASSISFWVKSNTKDPIIIQLKESNGESHSFQITPSSSWSKVSVSLSSLVTDASTKKDGKLDPAKVTEIVLADGAAAGGKKGSRKVVFSRWDFR